MESTEEWKPQKENELPVYVQIVRYIRGKIAAGEWPVGTLLPSQRTLADIFGVNRSTVVSALEELAADGLVEGRVGSGTRVLNNTWSLLSSYSAPDWEGYVRSGIHLPNQNLIRAINQREFDPEVIRMGTGELSPSLYPGDRMGKVLRSLSDRIPSMGYEQGKGIAALRRQVSDWLGTQGIDVSPDSVLIVSGALQAFQLIAWSLLKPGSTVLVEKPSYLHSIRVFQSAGMQLSGLEMDREGIRLEGVERHHRRQQPSLLYTTPTCHNPTGRVMSEKRRKELMVYCRQTRLPLIEDDVYRELYLDGLPPRPLKAEDPHGLILYLGSFSKILSPGLRIGWVVGPEPVVDRLADIKMQADYGASSLSQWTAAEWLAGGHHVEHGEEVRKALRERRKAADLLLRQHLAGLADWELPPGGFYIWLRLKREVPVHRLFEEALRRGVLLHPGSLYDPADRRHLRLSFAYAPMEEWERGIRVLAELLQAESSRGLS
ncbi:aminotransferase-like domain-containing protein [Salinithrix halophila]|uniref:PLP-dependent aminotransferase family protein n=1 Tax=Salinithrix halophila TaxID=1485204 RepID=A0ABV8JD49_9BACL